MLLWQWKNGHKKIILWSHLAAGALLLHIFFAFFLFFFCRHGVTHIVLTMKKNIHVIPVTFVRHQLKNSTVSSIKVPAEAQMSVARKKKLSPRKTSMVKPKPVKKKEIKKPIAPKKIVAKKEIKKEVKKIVPEKKEPLKEVPKPIIEKVPEVVQPIVQAPIVAQQIEAQDTIALEQHSDCEGIDNQQAELYALVAKQWAPPVGIAHDKMCEVSAEIGWKQDIVKVWISVKSGILMYDLAARKAVMQTQFPLWTRGKTITIRFVQ